MEVLEFLSKDSFHNWRQRDLESKSQHSQETGFVGSGALEGKTLLFLHPDISSNKVVLHYVL